MTTVRGLDLSTTATGVCHPDGFTETITPPGKWSLMLRCQAMRDSIATTTEADVYVIENYGTRFVHVAFGMGVVHGLIHDLLGTDPDTYKPSPNQLKKWATGKGNGPGTDKIGMSLKAAAAGWEPGDDAGDDEADAWWLWTIGKAIIDEPVVPETAYREAILEALTVV